MDAGLSHEPSETTRKEVRLLMSFGHSEQSVAEHLDLSHPTFRKHYAAEIKGARHHLELKAGAACYDNLLDDNAAIRQKAAEFILKCKCKWSDKTLSDETKNAIFDSIVQSAAQELLKKKEQENEY